MHFHPLYHFGKLPNYLIFLFLLVIVIKTYNIGGMENLLISSSAKKGRSLVLTEDANGAVDWIDAAELAESVGITFEQYPAWINSMHELGTVAVSDRIVH